ncbi:HD domain-containing protein [Dictyobacter aurantiacus]|uniref:Hydrolase n=1 Tax=Dictyobacter aurantiacus TaxID=1936993 RepID=A0A401ZJ67_9CHLR|nr:HD domain-containing protein [Dictyobacter aurantiacus]GCE06897.1 hydrolase [Dictyobacter aurantiacus]
MIDTTRLTQILRFLEIIDQFKAIYRANYLSSQNRHENDAEHTWHMAMFALLLHKELSIEVDIEHTLKLILTHDLVEIYAGDTPAFDVAGNLDREEREEQAAQALFAQLPEDLGTQVHDWWREFEACTTPEARYARAVDKLQSFAQNIFSQGRNWRENGVSAERSRVLNGAARQFDPALTEAFELLYQRGVEENCYASL